MISQKHHQKSLIKGKENAYCLFCKLENILNKTIFKFMFILQSNQFNYIKLKRDSGFCLILVQSSSKQLIFREFIYLLVYFVLKFPKLIQNAEV